jgi:DNA-binding transcriptional LysR family regulator
MSAANESRWAPRLAALDANLLVALDALLQEVSVTHAARRIGVTQSALSQTLARLRAQFDDPLLVRVGRRMALTPFASRIQGRLRRAMSELEAVVGDRPRFDPAADARRFVLAAVDYVSTVIVPPLERAFRRAAPRASLAVHALGARSIADRMEQGLVDLYVGVLGATERGLRAETLFGDTLSVVVRRGHPLTKTRLTAEAYAAQPHVHVSPRRDPGSIIDRALAAAGLERRVAIEVPYFGLVPDLLERSDLVATLPGRAAKVFASTRRLVLLPAPLELPDIEIGMAWHPAFEREPSSLWLRDLVRETSRAS